MLPNTRDLLEIERALLCTEPDDDPRVQAIDFLLGRDRLAA
jgi:hypothetical protein